MKETSFIEQNKEKWKRFESLYRSGTGNPDELSRLFIEITEDLSYSRTHYPKRTVRVYLNGLAQQVFNSLYKIKNYPLRRFAQFWTKSLPLEVFRMQRDILFALVVFLIAAGIGVISTYDDLDFARVILSNGYVEMTDSNIANNDPMAVYRTGTAFDSFVRIFFNNIRIDFITFIFGMLFGVGTLFVELYNGIMVGTFQSYFYFKGLLVKKALLYTTFLTIWIHGAFEISGIVLSGAAGFTLGRAIMFPGSLTRLQSLQLGARRGLKMLAGIAVFTLIAAIFEGYVTRHTEMAEWIKLSIIILSFAIMLLMFVFYPRYIGKKYPNEVKIYENPSFNSKAELKLYRVRTFNEMLSDTFALYRRNYKYFYKAIWFIAIPCSLALMWVTFHTHRDYLSSWLDAYEGYALRDGRNVFAATLGVGNFFTIFHTIILSLLFSTVFFAVVYSIRKNEEKVLLPGIWKMGLKKLVFTTVLMAVFVGCIQSDYVGIYFCFFFAAVFVFMPMYEYFFNGGGMNAWAVGMRKAGTSFSNALGLFIVVMLLIIIFSFLLTLQNYQIFKILIEWHVVMQVTDFIFYLQLFQATLCCIFIFHVIPLVFISFMVVFYHNEETETSRDLFARLQQFGASRKFHESSQWDRENL